MENTTPLVCGGQEIIAPFQMIGECYTVGTEANQEPLATLSVPRRDSSTILWNDNGKETLWITGGITDFWSPQEVNGSMALVSTELVSISSPLADLRLGPELPAPVSAHCMVKLNDSSAILTGGNHWWTVQQDSYSLLDTFFFTKTSVEGDGNWSLGPKLPCRMYDHVCGSIVDQDTKEQIAVVAGGQECFDTTLLLHLDDMEQNGDWTYGPYLPQPTLIGSDGITTPDMTQLILVGGLSDYNNVFAHKAMFSMSCASSDCAWTTMDIMLKIPRVRGLAILVPANYYVESLPTATCNFMPTASSSLACEFESCHK